MSANSLSSVRLPVPFVRWADVVNVPAGEKGSVLRRIYDHELVYVLEGGGGQVILDGRTFPTQADSLFLVQPGVYHSFLSPGESQRLLGVHFDFDPLPEGDKFTVVGSVENDLEGAKMRTPATIPEWDLNTTPVLDLKGRPRVRRRLEEVVTEYSRHDAHSRSIAGALLAAAIHQIEREVHLNNEIVHNEGIGADAVRRVQRARDWLTFEIENPPSIEEVARRVGWSADHLRRMFRAVLGTSPLEIQMDARIRKAQDLLRYRQFGGKEVALRCGFEDPAHFSRVFKRQTGLSPRNWLANEGERRLQKGRSEKSYLSGKKANSKPIIG